MNGTEKNNKVFIKGEIVSEATFSHEVYGEGFYELYVKVMRLSGPEDRFHALRDGAVPFLQ